MNSLFSIRRPGGALFEKTAPLDPLQKLSIRIRRIRQWNNTAGYDE
jgi:hypothetical protein